LDEIGDMPLELQSKLLQVLEQQEFVRVGGIHNIHVDVRIICATNRNLEGALQERGFRDDLFYRLNEITLHLPPLRERPEDIPLLVNYFIEKYNKLYDKNFSHLSPEIINQLMAFSWPGNVRQLENMIKQVVVRGDDSIIADLLTSANVPNVQPVAYSTVGASQSTAYVSSATVDTDNFSLKDRISRTVAEEEKKLIAAVLTKTNWNRRKAAEILGISYRSLLYKIKDYQLNASK
jgi:two-component system response regulator AtoC